MRVLGIDYGDKNIGLAISDPTGIIAQPHSIIKVTSLKKAANDIVEIIKEKNIEKIVIGLPLDMSGNIGNSAEKVQQFGDLIEKRINISIEYWDERFSSNGVERILRDAGIDKRQKRKKVIDKMAAAYILQGYLDNKL